MPAFAHKTFSNSFLNQVNPIPRAIKVARKGIIAKQASSVLIMNLNLLTMLSEIIGNLFLLKGIAQSIYVVVWGKEKVNQLLSKLRLLTKKLDYSNKILHLAQNI